MIQRCFFSLASLWLACSVALAEAEAVRFEIASDREFYLEESNAGVCLEIRLQGRNAGSSTAGQNVVFAFDRSGSMAGEPLQRVREAILEIAKSMRAEDSVSVLFFASEVDPALELRDDVLSLESRLSKIEAGGGSATYDALNQAAGQLRRTSKPGRHNHLVLLTDGPATKGPREKSDFVQLSSAFAKEGISLSTIGLGPDFDEDVLAAIARQGKGQFHYLDSLEKIREAVAAETRFARQAVARNLEVTFEFPRDTRQIEPYGSVPLALNNTSVTWQIPVVYSSEKRSLLVSARVRTQRSESTVGTLTAKWTDTQSGLEESFSQKFKVPLERDDTFVSRSRNVDVLRSVAGAIVTEGMQAAIERMDKGDLRGALRRLGRARTDVDYMNYGFDDPEIAAQVARLDVYLNEVKTRGLNSLDRKVLRSGLNNQFDSPSDKESVP